uniref:Uncharacterized protein n=1 Tax=Oryza glaberrima TaxID=4538 RepID=I1QJM3_ORYGL
MQSSLQQLISSRFWFFLQGLQFGASESACRAAHGEAVVRRRRRGEGRWRSGRRGSKFWANGRRRLVVVG